MSIQGFTEFKHAFDYYGCIVGIILVAVICAVYGIRWCYYKKYMKKREDRCREWDYRE
jgi:hypothetical protein